MKKVLFTALVAMSMGANAQTSFGVQAGVISPRVAMDTKSKSFYGNNKMAVGFKAGFFAEIPITSGLYFKPELNFVQKGGKFNRTETQNGVTGTLNSAFKTNHLELPLNVMYKIQAGGGNVLLAAGPVLSYGFGGKWNYKGTIGSLSESKDINIKFDGEKNYTDDNIHLKPLEVGANIYAGYELPFGLRAGVQFRPDFSQLRPNKNDGSYKNSYFGLTIGYKF